ncbi:MAG: AI-2E family transporter [Clostridia bacterium]
MNYLEQKNINIPNPIIGIIENSSENILQVASKYISTFFSNVIQMFSKIPVVAINIAITILSTYFICTDKFYMLDQLEHHLPKTWVKKMGNKIKKIISSLSNYLKAEAILILISFVIVLIRIIFLKSNRHANRVSASCSIGHRIC